MPESGGKDLDSSSVSRARPLQLALQRRQLLAAGVLGIAGIGLRLPVLAGARDGEREEAGWAVAQRIRESVVQPLFARRDFPITAFGAEVGEDASEAIARAIRACHEAGGGRVVVPRGKFDCGPVHLKSNVNLHLAEGAELSFSTDPARYLPAVFSRWEGMELMNYSPLVYAFGAENVALTGSGTLNGNADDNTWWPWKGPHPEQHWALRPGEDQQAARDRLQAQVEAGVPVAQRIYGDGAWLRPPMVQFYACKRVLVEGVTLRDSPFWLLNPVLCEDVTVRGVTCSSHGPNSDGCNPESCKRVLIEHCSFDTGDDCIAIKSGRNADGRRIAVPCENLIISDCDMRAGHGGVVIGSEISGGVRHVYAERCRMSSPELERALRIKTNSVRGGVLEHIYYRDIEVGQVRDVLVINYHYEEGDAGSFDPLVRDVEVRGLTVREAQRVFQVRGFGRDPVRDLRLLDISVARASEVGIIENVTPLHLQGVEINGECYPAC